MVKYRQEMQGRSYLVYKEMKIIIKRGGNKMNSIERVSLTLQHKEADHVPVYPLINSISRVFTGIDYATWCQDTDLCAESIIKATDELGVDLICSLVDLSVEAADFGQKIDYPKNE